jgi:flagellar protein FliL
MVNVTASDGKGRKARTELALVSVLGLAVLAAAAGGGCKHSSPLSKGPGKDSHAAVKAILHLEPFVVNLADSEDNRFLRVGIDLGLENELSAKEGKGGEGAVPTARIRDCILEVLSSWHSDALLAPEGKEKLKNELVRALHARAPEVGVKEIYFTDFLVQR